MQASRSRSLSTRLPRRVLEHIRTSALWSENSEVLIAVSGGLDSVVLLDVLHRTVGAHRGRLRVASCDHGLRDASASEVAFVAELAEERGLPFVPLRLEIPAGPDLAARARDARRQALSGLGAERIATGHHQDDQAETVLHHLLRGSGLDGLQGMRALDGAWCRPLLHEPREVLEAFATEVGLRWVEDPSNATSLRGQMRECMPLLDALHGGAGPALARTARLLARDAALIDAIATAAWQRTSVAGGLSLEALRREPDAIQARLVMRLCAGGGVRRSAAQVDQALRWIYRPQGALRLSGEAVMVARDGLLMIEKVGA